MSYSQFGPNSRCPKHRTHPVKWCPTREEDEKEQAREQMLKSLVTVATIGKPNDGDYP